MNHSALPKFSKPPVAETVLGVQFRPLPAFTTAHAGWFWKQALGPDWVKVTEEGRIEDEHERFGEDRFIPGGIKIHTSAPRNRIQIVNAAGDRMIQVQDSRFLYNWRKQAEKYPSFELVLPEFRTGFAAFEKFVAANALGPIEPNSWHVKYVNHLAKGEMWESLSDWKRIIPSLATPAETLPGQRFDGFDGRWLLELDDQTGRLHIRVRYGKVASGSEVLSLELTAQGPVPDAGIEPALRRGHEAIVRSFAAITSEEAHAHWGRTQ